MEIGYFSIKGEHCYQDVCLFINDNWKVGYERDLADGKIFFIENYSVMANNDLLIAITVQKVNASSDACELEIIAGGGGSGVFNIKFGNESRRVNQFYDIMGRFCEENSFSISEFART